VEQFCECKFCCVNKSFEAQWLLSAYPPPTLALQYSAFSSRSLHNTCLYNYALQP